MLKSAIITGLLAASTTCVASNVLLFPTFDSNGENGVYLMWSADGREFHQVNQGQPIFTPPQWSGQSLTRDPSIVFHDGTYHMVWTSNWNGNVFGYASSTNLVNWSTPQIIQPFATGEQPRNIWAPEIFRDPVAGNFRIAFAATLTSELNDGDGSGDPHGYDHRLYSISTTNFSSFSSPQFVMTDPGYSFIDGQIVYDNRQTASTTDDRWVMAWKNEMGTSQGGKNIRLATSPLTISPSSFVPSTGPIVGPGSSIRSGEAAEGPAIVRWNNEWLMYWDAYGNGHYSLATSPDLQTWTDATNQLSFPIGHPRHGTVFVADTATLGWEVRFPSDLNNDGSVGPTDWSIFAANNLTNLSSFNPTERAARGDLDGDGDNDFADFRLFEREYNSFNGAGALARLAVIGVPEPHAVIVGVPIAFWLLLRRTQSSHNGSC